MEITLGAVAGGVAGPAGLTLNENVAWFNLLRNGLGDIFSNCF
jgi:hypothetical protein